MHKILPDAARRRDVETSPAVFRHHIRTAAELTAALALEAADALDLAGMELDENPVLYVDGRLSTRGVNTFSVLEELREAGQQQP